MGVEQRSSKAAAAACPYPGLAQDNLGVMSIGFMLPNPDDAVIWRGPRKNGLIKQFLKDVHWGDLDYLVIDSPPGTSDEHISIVQVGPAQPSLGTGSGSVRPGMAGAFWHSSGRALACSG